MKQFIQPKQQLLILRSNPKHDGGSYSDTLLKKLPPISDSDYLQSYDDNTQIFTFKDNNYRMTDDIYTLSECGSYNCAFTVEHQGVKYALRVSYPQIDDRANYMDLQFNDKEYSKYKNIYGSYIPDINYYGLIIFKSKIQNELTNMYSRYLNILETNKQYDNDYNRKKLNEYLVEYGDNFDVCCYTIGKIYMTDFSRIIEKKNKYQIIVSLLNGLDIALRNNAFYDDLKLPNIGYYLTNEGKYEICFIDTDENTWVEITKKSEFITTYFPMWYPNRSPTYNPKDEDSVRNILYRFYAGGFATILVELFFNNNIFILLHDYLYYTPSKVMNEFTMSEFYSTIHTSTYAQLYKEVADILIDKTREGSYTGLLSSMWYKVPRIDELLDRFKQLLATPDNPILLQDIINKYEDEKNMATENIHKTQTEMDKLLSLNPELYEKYQIAMKELYENEFSYNVNAQENHNWQILFNDRTHLIDVATHDIQYAKKEIKAIVAQAPKAIVAPQLLKSPGAQLLKSPGAQAPKAIVAPQLPRAPGAQAAKGQYAIRVRVRDRQLAAETEKSRQALERLRVQFKA